MSVAPKLNDNWHDLVKEISQVIANLTGNVMEDKQRPMIESRLKRRCLDLKMSTAEEYRSFWKQHQDAENKVLIGLLTTHFTSFFREFMHFEWIARELPAIVSEVRAQGRKTIRIWSAAASKGQEVWSICMWLEHHLPQIAPEMTWTVLGSDIDEVSIKEAQNGVYHRRELETAPRHLWEGHWIRGKAEISDWYKIKSSLKDHAQFKVMNLLDLKLPPDEKFDLILSRNVLIYFDRENQKKIVTSLLSHLSPGGTLITGLSESLGGFGLPVKGVAPSVYKMQNAAHVSPVIAIRKTEELPLPMKVLCVDDSGTILTMLKKVLAPPQFEIIGVASNGLEAIEKLKTLRPDVITLDIHMPEMDGLSFLKTSGIAARIPVVIVSSVGRDHGPLMTPLRELGVVDFVEKPTLSNMNKIGEELIQKLKVGWLNRKKSMESSLPSHHVHSASRPPGMMVFNFGPGDEEKLFKNLIEEKWEKDHLIFRYRGDVFPAELKNRIRERIPKNQRSVFLRDAEPLMSHDQTLVWLCYQRGDFIKVSALRKKQDYLIVEEGSPELLLSLAHDVSPSTSFNYLVTKFMRGE